MGTLLVQESDPQTSGRGFTASKGFVQTGAAVISQGCTRCFRGLLLEHITGRRVDRVLKEGAISMEYILTMLSQVTSHTSPPAKCPILTTTRSSVAPFALNTRWHKEKPKGHRPCTEHELETESAIFSGVLCSGRGRREGGLQAWRPQAGKYYGAPSSAR